MDIDLSASSELEAIFVHFTKFEAEGIAAACDRDQTPPCESRDPSHESYPRIYGCLYHTVVRNLLLQIGTNQSKTYIILLCSFSLQGTAQRNVPQRLPTLFSFAHFPSAFALPPLGQLTLLASQATC